MIHITQVEIRNFSTHRHTVLDFSEGVNALIGRNSAGKSNALSAIQWCLTNHLTGTDFIRYGEKEACVRVSLSNGYTIERIKGHVRTHNFYRLYQGDAMLYEYTGFRKDVPKEIKDVHRMMSESGQAINFHNQLEPLFLVANTPSQRATFIGNLEELAKVDRANSTLNEDIRDNTRDIRRIELEIKDLEKQQKRLGTQLDIRHATKQTLEQLIETLQRETRLSEVLRHTGEQLNVLHVENERLQSEVQSYARVTEGFPDSFRPDQVNRLFHIFAELTRLQGEMSTLRQTASIEIEQYDEYVEYLETSFVASSRLNKIVTQLNEYEAENESHRQFLERLPADIVAVDLSAVERQLEQYQILFRHHQRLHSLEEGCEEAKTTLVETSKEIDTLFEDMINLLTKNPFCETCGQSTANLTHDCVENTIR